MTHIPWSNIMQHHPRSTKSLLVHRISTNLCISICNPNAKANTFHNSKVLSILVGKALSYKNESSPHAWTINCFPNCRARQTISSHAANSLLLSISQMVEQDGTSIVRLPLTQGLTFKALTFTLLTKNILPLV